MLERIKIVQGDKATFLVYVDDVNGRPVDLSIWDDFHVCIPYEGGTLEITDTAGVDGSVVDVLGDPVLGTLEITIGPTNSALLDADTHDMQVKLDNSVTPNPKSQVFSDILEVIAKLCPDA